MGPDDLHRLQVAFAIVGGGIGFLLGKYVRDHFQIGAAPGLVSLAGAVRFFYAAFYLLMFILAVAAFGLYRLAWRYRSAWTPLLEPLLRRLARRRRSSPSVAEQLTSEQDDFDACTEAVLTQPYPPDIKRTLLEQLEGQHKNRLRGLLGKDDSLSDH